jgi:aminoglycoside phosphotransferase (APT) family kinase protein
MAVNTDCGLASLIPAILKSIEHTIRMEVADEVTSANAKVQIDMVRRLLHWSIAELERHHELYTERINSTSRLLANGKPSATEPANGTPALYSSPTNVEKRYFVEAGLLSATFERNMQEARNQVKKREALAVQFRRLVEAEVRFHASLDPESAADIASAYHGGKGGKSGDSERTENVTADSLTAYLRRRFPEQVEVKASDVQTLAGGMGKDTILFEMSGHPQYAGPLVMRKDLPVLALEVSAVDEFELLQAAHEAGVNVPEPLWAEHDSKALGSRFIVVRRARGTVAIAQDISDVNIRRHFADKLAEGLVAIHNLQVPKWAPYRSVSGKTLNQTLHEQIATWRSFWMRKRLEPSVKLEAIFAWLEANIPPESGIAPTLVHGDYGFHNLIMDQGEVTAILDWEFAHMGDPAEDVNYCRQFIERYVSFDYFLDCYLARGGKPYDDARDRFFTVWRNLRNAIASVGALHAFHSETPGNIKMATAGLAYNPRFELEALRLVTEYLESGVSS